MSLEHIRSVMARELPSILDELIPPGTVVTVAHHKGDPMASPAKQLNSDAADKLKTECSEHIDRLFGAFESAIAGSGGSERQSLTIKCAYVPPTEKTEPRVDVTANVSLKAFTVSRPASIEGKQLSLL